MQAKAPNIGAANYGAIIGPKIRNRRRSPEIDITLEELAERLREVGVEASAQVVWAWERGKRRDFYLHEIEALAYALQCPIRELWEPKEWVTGRSKG